MAEPHSISPTNEPTLSPMQSPDTNNDCICHRCVIALRDIISQLGRTADPTYYDPIWALHHPNVPSLRASAQAGCGICKIVMNIMRDMSVSEHMHESFSEESVGVWPDVAVAGEEKYERLRFYTDPLTMDSFKPSQRGAMRFGYYMYDKVAKVNSNNFKGSPPWLRITQKTFINHHLIGREIAQRPQVDIAASWLAGCVNHHEACRGLGNKQSHLPTRVLEITGEEPSISYRVRLVQTRNMPRSTIGQYAALSHCWGLCPPKVLTTITNLSSHLSDIPFALLARNFQDAVRLTAMLGIRYLWIDSLCIVQDDENDWRNECSKMASTFQNATITIAAEGASDAHAGFWNERVWASTLSCSFTLPHQDGPPLQLTAMRDDIGDKPFLGTERPPVLRKRGWVHQERLLSPRTLYCGSKQMYFECLVSQRFEDLHPSLAQRISSASEALQFSIRAPWLRGPDVGDLSARTGYNQYYDIISDYSRCRLTKEDDRLSAISGVATRFRGYSKDVYLAGIWKGDILRGLCWSCTKTHLTNDLPATEPTYSPPSWSWASCRYPVNWRARDFTGNTLWPTQLVSSHIEYVCHDVFGQVTGGELRLFGMVRRGFIANTPELKDLPNAPDTSTRAALSAWLFSARGPDTCQSSMQLFDHDALRQGLCWFFGDKPLLGSSEVFRKDVSCLLLGVRPVTQGEKSWFVWVGLALEPVSDRLDTFRRVGLLVRWSDVDVWLIGASDSLRWVVAGERTSVCII